MKTGCADEVAVRDTVTDIEVKVVVSPLFQEPRFLGQYVSKLLLPGWCVFGMALPLSSNLKLPEGEQLGVEFPLCLGLRLPVRYEFLSGRFVKLICHWLMTRLLVASRNSGHVDARSERARHK